MRRKDGFRLLTGPYYSPRNFSQANESERLEIYRSSASKADRNLKEGHVEVLSFRLQNHGKSY
jgi:hypothetical protein